MKERDRDAAEHIPVRLNIFCGIFFFTVFERCFSKPHARKRSQDLSRNLDF